MPPDGIARPKQNSDKKRPVLALAFDHLNLTIGNMWKLNYYLPAVEQSFRDTVESDDAEEVDAEVTMNVDVDVS